MNLAASTPAATTFGPLAASTFGPTGLSLVSHDPVQNVSGFPSPTTFSNATPTEFGQQTNKSIVYHYSTKSDNPDALGPGALIFSFRNPRCFELHCPDRSKYVKDLIDMNRWFLEMAKPENKTKSKLLDTAENVLRQINFMGVLKGAITGSSRERHLGTCVLNNVVGERASTINVWRHGAKEGVPLHIILTKEVSQGVSAWKFVPYAGHGPPVRELMYEEGGKWCVGGSIFIGTAISSPSACAEGNENLLDDPKRSLRLASYAGGVDVCIGV